MERFLTGREIKFRLVWFVALRYAATLALVGLGLLNRFRGAAFFDVDFVWPLVGVMFVYNTALLLILDRVRFARWRTWAFAMAHLQIAVDFVFLTVVLHFTGGIESPALAFYAFHAVIAAILLLRWEAYLHAALAVILVLGVAALEAKGVLAHHHLHPGPSRELYRDPSYVMQRAVFFVVTMGGMTSITASLARELGTREHLIRETVGRLQAANEHLRAQDKIRAQFVRTVAHDLKEPLAAIQTTLRVVLDGYAGEVDPRARDLIARADQSAARLISMIRDMLDLGRIRSGWVGNREVWAVRELLDGVLDKLGARAKDKNQRIETRVEPPDLKLFASKDAFEQVFLNLISNAIKYSDEGARVGVWVRRADDGLWIRVEDQGMGIPPEDQERLFTEFFRSTEAKRKSAEGTGLGLVIVKTIVEQYEGKIRVESPYTEAHGGTRFEIEIPWKAVAV